MNPQILPLNAVDDYAGLNLPSAAYAPACRRTYARIHAASFVEDISFKVVDGKRELATCLLAVRRLSVDDAEVYEFWSLGLPAVFWWIDGLSGEERQASWQAALNAFKVRAARYPQAQLSLIDYFQEGLLNGLSLYALQSLSKSAHLSFTHVVDLTRPESALKAAVRSSYKSLINNGHRKFEIEVFAKDIFTEEHLRRLHDCHQVASGRDVYPDTFWRALGHLVKDGQAYLVIARDGENAVGASLYFQAEHKVYYAIGAFDRSLEHTGLSHACLWEALLHAKKIGCHTFETGRTDFAVLKPDVSEKIVNIGFFKRGFGGDNRPVLYIT